MRGFAQLAQTNTFAGKAVRLGTDINLNNEGEWLPIGTVSKPFEGTFDGQGFKIRGLSVKDDSSRLGLFGVTAPGSTITNVRLVDSTITQISTASSHYTGSIVAEAYGNVNKVYSNAVIRSNTPYIGGIIACTNGTSVALSDCWFDGTITAGTGANYIGGIVANQYNNTMTMNNVLFTGTIDADTTGTAYIGGLVGNSAKTLSIDSAIAAGHIVGSHSHSKVASVVGNMAVSSTLSNVFSARDCYGIAYNKASGVTLTGEAVQTSGSDRLIGLIPQGTNGAVWNTETVSYRGDQLGAPYNGIQDKELAQLTFGEGGWSLRTQDVPVLTCFKDIVGTSNVVTSSTASSDLAKEIGLDLFGCNSITDVMESGMGNYVYSYIYSGSGSIYEDYLAKIGASGLGFTQKYNNDGTPMKQDGVYSSTWTKGNWVLNVTYVDREVTDKVGGYYVTHDEIFSYFDKIENNIKPRTGKRLYISFNTSGVAGAGTLASGNALATADGSDKVTLAMLEDLKAADPKVGGGANSFVFRLPNGHFVINDGGYNDATIPTLLKYLTSQVKSGEKVYIDAWTISHFHNDHMAVIDSIINNPTLWKDVRIDAFYVGESSTYALKSWEQYGEYDYSSKMHKAAGMMTKADGVTKTDVWQLHMGQRYYFNGLTMDVIETSEQHDVRYWNTLVTDSALHLPDSSNTASTQLIFTVTDGDQKVLLGGDATIVNMDYMMQAYGTNSYTFANMSVVAAYHHGKNVYYKYNSSLSSSPNKKEGLTNWVDFMLKNTRNKNGSSHQFDVVLFPDVQILDIVYYNGGWYPDGSTTAGSAFPRNVGYISRYMATNAGAYYTMGYEDTYSMATGTRHGNVILTFNSDTSVSAECKASQVTSVIEPNSVAGKELWWDDVKTDGYYTKK